MNRLNRETEKTLRELFPALEPASAGRAAALLRDGRAAALGEIEAISPLLRTELEKAAENSPIRESPPHGRLPPPEMPEGAATGVFIAVNL